MRLFLSRVHFPVHTLGPGERVGIWFQGCSIRCPGCISVDTWENGKGETSVEVLLQSVRPWLLQADGITISGGEPFDQEEALLALLTGLRKIGEAEGSKTWDILVYSGHRWEGLAEKFRTSGRFHGLIDALMTDPFLVSETQTKALRGSDNQRFHFLTPLGKERFLALDRDMDASDQVLDFMLGDDGEVWLAGIPRRGDLEKLKAWLADNGHAAATTEGRVVG